MRNGNFSRYYDISSPIHLLNPLCKILLLFIFILMSILGSSIRVICSLFIVLVYIVIISNVPLRKYFDILFRLKFFLFFVFVINLFFNSFYGSIIIVSRICLIVIYYFVMLFTTTTNELIYGFSRFLSPLSFFGFCVFKFSTILAVGFNYIPCFFLVSNRLKKAKISRGSDYYNCSFFNKFICYFSNIKDCLVLSFRDLCYIISKFKSFNYICDKSFIYDSKFCFSDVYMIMCHIMILVFVLIKEVIM